MPFTKNTPPCGAVKPNASSFPTVTETKRNSTENWRGGGETDVKTALSNSPTKQPVNPDEVKQ
jgi:hypothetical protein